VQNALQEQALLAYRSTILRAWQDVENALIAYDKEQQHRTALAAAVAANRQAVDLSTHLYRQGQTDFLNVLSAQRSLYASEDALVQSNRTVTTSLIALYKALGGGWETQE
jgi:outer membrane protein TolC